MVVKIEVELKTLSESQLTKAFEDLDKLILITIVEEKL